MTLLNVAQLMDVLGTAERDLFRWEALPAYEVAADGTDYRRYLDGAADPTWERKQPWLDTLRAEAQRGRARRRVRVIHDPITDYERYACEWGYALNAEAGEQIRVIDLAATGLPPECDRVVGDFWLIDNRDVVAMHYAPDGQFEGARVLDPQHVRCHRAAAEASWRLGEDFAAWWGRHPQHHRAAHYVA